MAVAPLCKVVGLGVSVKNVSQGLQEALLALGRWEVRALLLGWDLCSMHETQGRFPAFPSRLTFRKQPFIVSYGSDGQTYVAP